MATQLTDHFAAARWVVQEGKEDEFIDRWREFLEWTRKEFPQLQEANLVRNKMNPSLFISFANWSDPLARDSWLAAPGFQERMQATRALCRDFEGGASDRVVAI